MTNRIAIQWMMLLGLLTGAAAEPLRLDLTPAPGPVITGHLGLGTTNDPSGHTLWADSRCLYRDGKPFIPVMGEFHFSRYPAAEWREELLKMKAGGISVVATYVFWIHHEEEQGKFDWSGQRSLRHFLQICRDLNLLAVVRLGPWCHGEVRNGGFPDWIQQASFWPDDRPFKERTTHPEFMKYTGLLYREIAAQMEGLLWKDGGPVIGVQHDNECWNPAYLLALKKLARECGIDVPFYTMTGWNAVPIPDSELLPLFGGYADGFWYDDPSPTRKSFLFTPIRDDGDMGAVNGRLVNTRPERNATIQRFPYLCCEIGGGMPSSYSARIHVHPLDVAALALVKLGNGNNLPGYYMYHGGINPDGRLTTLNETKAQKYPNDLPVKDYDFNAPIGAAGQLREHYFLLRQQHLFLQHFGDRLALMPAFFPQPAITSLEDTNSVRWTARSDGERGFIFFNNHQRYQPLPPKPGVQFSLKTRQGDLLIPKQPVTLPSGSHGILPFNLDCGGVQLTYATAQPLCYLDHNGARWLFFSAIDGIRPEFSFPGQPLRSCEPGPDVAFSLKAPGGKQLHFVVLDAIRAACLASHNLGGRIQLTLSHNALFCETNSVFTLETFGNQSPELALFPPVKEVIARGEKLSLKRQGVFTVVRFPKPAPALQMLDPVDVRPAQVTAQPLNAMDETAWKSAAVWRFAIARLDRNSLLRLSYVGDVARLYAGGKLIADQFYHGQPWTVAAWRIPEAELGKLELHVMPLHKNFTGRLPPFARPGFGELVSIAELTEAAVLEKRQLRLTISP